VLRIQNEIRELRKSTPVRVEGAEWARIPRVADQDLCNRPADG
jgi:hypothetical protein